MFWYLNITFLFQKFVLHQIKIFVKKSRFGHFSRLNSEQHFKCQPWCNVMQRSIQETCDLDDKVRSSQGQKYKNAMDRNQISLVLMLGERFNAFYTLNHSNDDLLKSSTKLCVYWIPLFILFSIRSAVGPPCMSSKERVEQTKYLHPKYFPRRSSFSGKFTSNPLLSFLFATLPFPCRYKMSHF